MLLLLWVVLIYLIIHDIYILWSRENTELQIMSHFSKGKYKVSFLRTCGHHPFLLMNI